MTTPPKPILDGAGLQFTQNAGALTPGAPTQPGKPGIITMRDGRQLKVKVEIQINGEWKEVDTSKLSDIDLTNLVDKCQRIYTATTHAASAPKSLTVYFQNTNATESWKSTILGKFSKSFKEEPVALNFKKLEYKTTDSDKTQIFDLETDKLEEADADELQALVKKVVPFAKAIFSNREALTSPKKIKRSANQERESEANAQKLAEVKRVLNVQEAGAQGNRCAALSVASILLTTHKTLEAAVQSIQDKKSTLIINIVREEGVSDLITLSNILINLAADTIRNNPKFSNSDPSNSYYDHIVAALRAARQPEPANTAERKTVVEGYAELTRKNGEMLDVPFFDALNELGIPSITLVPSNGDLILGSVSPSLSFANADHSIDGFDPTAICFVVREGLHYQPVILGTMPTGDQVKKLRTILRDDLTKTLGQLAKVVADKKSADAKYDEVRNLVTSVMTKYPFDARSRIIQMLKDCRRTFHNDALNNNFIEEAVRALLSEAVL